MLLEIALTVMALVLGFAILSLRRQLSATNSLNADLEKQLDSQRSVINALSAAAAGVDRRLRRLENHEQSLRDRQENLESVQQRERPYGEAIRLVQQGASVDRLVEELGLSQSEAELISMLHGMKETG